MKRYPVELSCLVALAALLLSGCDLARRGHVAEADVPDFELTPELAREVIGASPEFRLAESRVHVLEWQLAPGEEAGLWAIRKTKEGQRTRITVEVLDASPWLARAEYFAGGVVPLHLREPISRRVVDIEEMTDAEYPQMKEVRFTWQYVGSPADLHALRPELIGGPYPARVRVQFQEDSWKVVGAVRESRIAL